MFLANSSPHYPCIASLVYDNIVTLLGIIVNGAGSRSDVAVGAKHPLSSFMCRKWMLRPYDPVRPDHGQTPKRIGQPQGVAPTGLSLSRIVHRFKTLTTKRYADSVKERGWPTFRARLWQRGYFDHVVRDDRDLERIRDYIATNPLRWALDRENPQRAGSTPAEDGLFDLDRAP